MISSSECVIETSNVSIEPSNRRTWFEPGAKPDSTVIRHGDSHDQPEKDAAGSAWSSILKYHLSSRLVVLTILKLKYESQWEG